MQTEFEIDGVSYRADRLDAFKQLHLTRKLAPTLPKLVPLFVAFQAAASKNENVSGDLAALATAAEPFAEALAAMPDADAEYVVKTCLAVVRKQIGGAWSPLVANGALMDSDMGLDVVLPLVVRVLRENLGNFTQGLLAKAPAAPAASPAPLG